MMDRTPPYAAEAEATVLGAMLIDPEAVPVVLEIIDDKAFYREANRRVFRSICRLFQRGQVSELVAVIEDLKATGELEAVGGVPYLAELQDTTPTGVYAANHAGIVRDKYHLRRIIDAGSEIIRDAYEQGERTPDEIQAEAEARIFKCAPAGGGDMVWVKKLLYPVFEQIEERQGTKPGEYTGIPSGLTALDEYTGGFQKGDLIIVAARPSQGKTALACTMMAHMAIAEQAPVGMFSLEMSRDQVVTRLLSLEALVDLSAIMRGRLGDSDFVRLAQAAGHLNTAPLYIEDRAALHVNQVQAIARRRIKEFGLKALVVDYIGLMKGDGESMNERVGSITGGLKALAKEQNIPVIALCQLSRALASRSDKRPQLTDLRDSGSIEQDADLVIFVHRPEYYLTPKEAQEQGLVGQAELIIGKQRNGPTGIVEAFFRKECARFENGLPRG